VLRAFSLH